MFPQVNGLGNLFLPAHTVVDKRKAGTKISVRADSEKVKNKTKASSLRMCREMAGQKDIRFVPTLTTSIKKTTSR